jgi:23S rRNA (uracil1939-C5)-methyltransferase
VTETIVRIAARGDGVTASGRHAAFAAPGDVLLSDGTVEPGPHHQVPPCRHFPDCGGCQLQHVDDAAFADYLKSRIAGALAQHELETRIEPPRMSPPRSRRRATLRALKTGKSAVIGFNAAKSNRVVDLHECHVLRPELFTLIEPLRALLEPLLKPKRIAEIQVALADQGPDVLISGIGAPAGYEQQMSLTDFAAEQGLARLSIDSGIGPETLYEPEPATICLSGRPVRLPPGAFLQATADGEAALVEAARLAVADAGPVADLFAGLGTFALGLSAEFAAEASRDVAAALAQAERSIRVEHRDLYRRPLDTAELSGFGAVVLDPPRAGAHEQVVELARSSVGRIAYISCNPATFARDARTLVDGGYKLDWVRPVGQFRWSTHIELAAGFRR